MKQKIPAGAFFAAVVVGLAFVAYFGWRTMSGGPNGDVTKESIAHYQELKRQAQAHKPTSPEEASKAGAPMSYSRMGSHGPGGSGGGSAPMGSAPMGSAPMGSAPMGSGPGGSAPMGSAPMGGGGR